MKKSTEKYPMVFETFREIGAYEKANLRQIDPDCFNGVVSFRKYRVTVEEVHESPEVIRGRLRKMWRECQNHHNWQPLQEAAKSVGLTLQHSTRRLS